MKQVDDAGLHDGTAYRRKQREKEEISEMEEKMIELKHVTKSYDKGEKPVVEDISFSVEQGKIHGLIGPNGSGKTTLIKCITGILKVDSGEILMDGKPVFHPLKFLPSPLLKFR